MIQNLWILNLWMEDEKLLNGKVYTNRLHNRMSTPTHIILLCAFHTGLKCVGRCTMILQFMSIAYINVFSFSDSPLIRTGSWKWKPFLYPKYRLWWTPSTDRCSHILHWKGKKTLAMLRLIYSYFLMEFLSWNVELQPNASNHTRKNGSWFFQW